MSNRHTNPTATAKLSSKYQTVIPSSIRRRMGLEKGSLLLWKLRRENGRVQATVEAKPQNWSQHLSGLGKKVWEGVDTDKYIKDLRKEWKKH